MAASGEYVTLLFSGSYGYPKMELGLHHLISWNCDFDMFWI